MGCCCNDCDCKNEKKVRVSFCPNCKSRDVKYVFELRNLFGVLPKMRCSKCKTEMASFPILVSSKEEIENAVMRKSTTKEKAVVKKKSIPKVKTGDKKK